MTDMHTKRLLIVVDLQKDFLPGGALGVKEGDQIIPVINQLLEKFDSVVATQDWHPPDHVSFAKTHGKAEGEVINLNGTPQVLWPVHCVQNSWGAELASQFEKQRVEKIFYKGTDQGIDSYSAVYDNAKMKGTGLKEFLKENGFDEIFVVGLATDYCVKYTALDLRALGYKTHVILNACRGVDLAKGDVGRAIDQMRDAGVKLL